MATPSKVPRQRKAPAATAKPAALPSLRFFHSDALRAETLEVLNSIAEAPDPLVHRDALADLVVTLTHSGLEYFFVEPMQRAKVGFVAQQSAKIGLSTMERFMGSVGRNIISHMDAKQLRSVCDSVRTMMD